MLRPPTARTQQNGSGDLDFVETLLSLFPRIFYTINQTLETASEGVSKKAGVVLWNIYFSDKEHKGRYLETKDVAKVLQEWFVVTSSTANQASNSARKELFEKDFIITREAPKRIYLTEAGEQFFVQMLNRVRTQIGELLNGLNDKEQAGLLMILQRTMKDDGSGTQSPLTN